MWPNPEETADSVTFTEKSRNRKLYFLCSECAVILNVCKIEEKIEMNIVKRNFLFLMSMK